MTLLRLEWASCFSRSLAGWVCDPTLSNYVGADTLTPNPPFLGSSDHNTVHAGQDGAMVPSDGTRVGDQHKQ